MKCILQNDAVVKYENEYVYLSWLCAEWIQHIGFTCVLFFQLFDFNLTDDEMGILRKKDQHMRRFFLPKWVEYHFPIT